MSLPLELAESLARYISEKRHFDDRHRSFPALFFTPQPLQRTFLESHARHRWISGGNRAGKTITAAVDVALLANGVKGLVYPGFPDECEPVHGWAVSKTYKQAQEVTIKKLLWALGKTLAKFDESKNVMYLWNGSTIGIKSEDSGFEVFQGADLDFVWKDEIGTMPIHEECRARLVDRNGIMLISYTPTKGRDWSYPVYYRPWRDATGGEPREHDGVLFVRMDTYENPYLPRSAIADLEKRCYTEEDRQIRLHGHYVDAAGLVFPTFSRGRNVIPPFEIPEHWPRFRGMDWGQRSPAACIWCAVDPDSEAHYFYREFYEKERTIAEICAAIRAMSGTERYAMTLLDPSCWNREGQKDALGRDYTKALIYSNHGVPAIKAQNDIQVGIDRMRGLMGRIGEPTKFFVFDGACPNLVRELMDLPWKSLARGVENVGIIGPDAVEERVDDHAVDSARYLCVATKFMVKTDSTGFVAGPQTGFEVEAGDGSLTRLHTVVETVPVPGREGMYTYRMKRVRGGEDGFEEHGAENGFDG